MAAKDTFELMLNPRLADHVVKVGDVSVKNGMKVTVTAAEYALLRKHHTKHSGERVRTFVDWAEPEKTEEEENPDLSSVTLSAMSGKLNQ